MTTNHIDQLAQWHADAEQITKANLPRIGDTLILPYNAGGYGVEVEGDGWTPDDVVPGEPVRILARAPKPKPAWHDAVAVRARWEDPSGDESEPFDGVDTFVNGGDGWWIGGYDNARPAEELHDVTPLIEAKVTDEMVTRAHVEMLRRGLGDYSDRALASIIAAALGLETA